MIVCHCKGITDRDLRRQFDKGVTVRTDEFFEQGAGSVCGGCRPLIDRLLREYAAAADPPPKNKAQ